MSAIANWPRHEQPRERLLASGPGVLSDAELVSLFVRGDSKMNSVERSRHLLADHGGLVAACAALSVDTALLAAAMELAKRNLATAMKESSALTSPQAVRDYLRLALQGRQHEVFIAIFLDAQHRVVVVEELFRGTLTQTSVYPREVVKAALRVNGAAVLFAHNHPSGVAQPSNADEMITRSLRDALALVDVKVLDHFIVAGNQTLSFSERGLL